MLFAQKNEKPGKGLCEILRGRAKSHTAKRETFRSAEGQREPNQLDLVWGFRASCPQAASSPLWREVCW